MPASSPELLRRHLGRFCEVQAGGFPSTLRTQAALPNGSSLTLGLSLSTYETSSSLAPHSTKAALRKIKCLKNHQLFQDTQGTKEVSTSHLMPEAKGVSWS